MKNLRYGEREKSAEYINMLRAIVNHFDYIENGKIKSFELFEPFKSFYEGAELKWEIQNLQENQWVVEKEENVSQLLHSDDEWLDSYRTALKFLKELFRYEGSRSSEIKQTEGSTGTLLDK